MVNGMNFKLFSSVCIKGRASGGAGGASVFISKMNALLNHRDGVAHRF